MSSLSPTPSLSTLQRSPGTPPPPTRPRLFARTGADRISPPPPARLAPITPTIPPEPVPYWRDEGGGAVEYSTTAVNHVTASQSEQHQHHVSGDASRPTVMDDEEGTQHTPLQAEAWSGLAFPFAAASTSSFSSPLLRTLVAQQGGAKRQVHTRTALHSTTTSANAARTAGLQEQTTLPRRSGPSRVVLTPPRGGSGLPREGSAEGHAATNTGDWSGHGRVETMLAAKRERLISSADTQHSVASSSTPPPRSKRAISNEVNVVALPGTQGPQLTLSPPTLSVGDVDSSLKRAGSDGGRHDRRRLSASTSRCSSSRGAITDSSSSDLATTAAAAMIAATPGTMTNTTITSGGDGSARHGLDDNASAQCLVLDDTVDSTTLVSTDQMRRLHEQAAGNRGVEEPPSAYRRSLITAEVLRDWTGWEDLELVLATQLRVDAEAMIGVVQISQHLPRLSSLKLNGSRIPLVRQLGTGFNSLKFLWLNSCRLTDLRGLAACCPALVELYVSFNYITDVTPVMGLASTLEVLDVEGNLLEDAAGLGFVLASLPKVTTLALQGNPITCEHQERVRAAYVMTVMENGGEGAAATPAAQPERFADVLRAWVRCLMPGLQTLNDEAMQVSAAPAALPSSTTTDAAAAPARAVHVDPLDDRLAEELRLVEACVRETDPFDPLREAVEESNRTLYTRPSTSCNGARPRLTPATAMGASRPSTSARSRATTSRRLGDATPTDASMLTTGAVLAGSATASLRRRLVTLGVTPLTPSLDSALGAVHGDYETAVNGAVRMTSTRLGSAAHRDDHSGGSAGSAGEEEGDEQARVAALLADDSEEDEWEKYKTALLLSSSRTSNAGVADAKAGATPAHRASLFSLPSAVYAEEVEAASGAAALTPEEDGFEKELKSEWWRLRLRMAKAGQA